MYPFHWFVQEKGYISKTRGLEPIFMSKYGIIKGTSITEVGNMSKKLLALLAAGALVITGCASKENTQNKEDNKKEEHTNESSEEKNKVDKNQELSTIHDFAAAEKLANVVAISGDDLSRLSTQTNLLHWITQSKIKKTTVPGGEELYAVASTDYLDSVNEISSKTYSMEEAIDLLKGPNFNEYDIVSEKSTLVPREDEVYYYKEDKVIVFTTKIMGNNFSQEVESQDKWVVEGDKIKINVVDKMTKTKISTITLKINNKQYAGGNAKSKYYVESIKNN